MATTKPRINVTLEPHRFELYKRLAALQGVSMSSLVAELLETVAEPMERVCVVLEAAKTAPSSVLNGLRSAIGKAEAELMPNALTVVEQGNMFFTEVENALVIGGEDERSVSDEQNSARAATTLSPSAVAPDPRLVTRGSTPTNGGGTLANQETIKPLTSKRSTAKKRALS